MQPLLERQPALDALRQALASAAAGAGRVALVSGEAGIGKTMLITRFLAAHAADARVLQGACDALFTPQPLGPLHDIARDARGPLAARLTAGADRTALFGAVLDELVTPPSPVVLVLEDIHWADAATLDLTRHLGRRLQRLPALLVLTYRDDEVDGHPALRQVLGELPAGVVDRIALERLSPPAVAALAEAAGVSAAGVFLATGGNPFFVTEVIAHPGGHIPATVRDAVLGRAAKLGERARALLDFVAIAPRAAEHALVDAVLGPSLADVEACIRGGLLLASADDLRFRHELARVAVEAAILPVRARHLHARAFAALQAIVGAGRVPRASLARLMHHARLAGDGAAVVRLEPAASAEAAIRGARREAAAYCRAALDTGLVAHDTARAALLDRYATHLFETNELEASIAARGEAIALHRAAGDTVGESLALAGQAMAMVRALRNADADEASRRALAAAQGAGEGAHRGRVFATEAYLRMLARDYEDAVTWSERGAAVAARHDDQETLAAAHTWMGAALMFVDFERGFDIVRHGLALSRDVGDGGVRTAGAYVMLGTASGELFRLDHAERYLDEGIAFAHERDVDRLHHYMLAWRALVDMYRGRWREAEARAADVLARGAGMSTHRVMALVALGRVRARRGDAAAASLLDEALALAERSGTLQRIAPVRAARAEAAWLAGDLAGAAHEASAALPLAQDKSHPWFVGELAQWLWRTGSIPELRVACAAPYAHALAGDWRAAAQAWLELGCPYEAACALADGDAAGTQRALATFDSLGAAPMAERVRAALREAGVTAVPRGPRATTRAHPAGLTAREAEVLALLAAGLANAAIARRLSRSPRTVEHHLAAILGKLGAQTRTEAVALARERGWLAAK